ncbi:MAG TPA: argininosuccinate lyase [Clostridia bacterium]|nr:argininosuccinate lyase [Clostridia bacterium]
MKMWSGRIRQPLDGEFEKWQRSFPFDKRLLGEELAASRAHALALQKLGVLSATEYASVLVGLEKIARNPADLMHDEEAEDIHHFVEKHLVAFIGDTGYKLHSGRSRNEQIATDLRLYVRSTASTIRGLTLELAEVFTNRAGRADEAAMPAYTHLQRAEPVLVAHWLLAYAEMFLRDASRLSSCMERLDACPLGSGAIAGATLPLDREAVAHELGFAAPTANSIDATSDRDFLLEFVQVLSIFGVHLSRWAEEFTLFATQEYGFVRLPERYSTGSSAMPQKQNPDSLELVRGKSARLIGAATTLLTAMKGLPLAYNKDMQETQEPVFDAADTALGMLRVALGFMREVEFDLERMQAAAQSSFMNAMAAATYLVLKGVPFRHAHEFVASAVRVCLARACELQDLSLLELKGISPKFEDDFYSHLTLQSVLNCHDVAGGTAPAQVQRALEQVRRRISALKGVAHASA